MQDLSSALPCSDYASQQSSSPVGTGVCTQRLILIDAPTPWPAMVPDHPIMLETVTVRNQSYFRRSRVFLAEPKRSQFRVQVFEQAKTGTRYNARLFETSEELNKILEALPNSQEFSILTKPVFLVCTHGTRDTCCGAKGSLIATEAESSGHEIERISHTAGHRFAPTMISMPDGHSWAFIDLTLFDELSNGQVPTVASQYRGWWGAKPGPAQQAVHQLALKGVAPSDILSIESTYELITIITKTTTYQFETVATGKETIVQCQVIGGGSLKYRDLYDVFELS